MDIPKRSYSLVSRLRQMLLAMLLLPILAGVAFFILHSSHVLQDNAQRELSATLSLERQFIEQWMGERVRHVADMAGDERVLRLGPRALAEFLTGMGHEARGFDAVVFVNASGRIAVDPVYHTDIDVSDREYFQAARRGESYVSDVLVSRQSGRRTVIVSSPVLDARGGFHGLVFGAVDLETLNSLLMILQREATGRTYLTQSNGLLISPHGKAQSLRPGDAIFDRALAREDGRGIYRNTEDRRVVGAYQWIMDGRWLLVGEKDEMDILALHAGILGVPLLGAAIVFLFFGPVALRLARSLQKPLRRLEDHARRIESGDFGMDCDPEPDAGDPQEVRRLNLAYCLMVDRVRTALEDLRQASFTDHLTGAANRKLLFHEGPRLIDAARRGRQGVSLLMLDLDRFKTVNDTHGHAAGDAVLAAFAALLRRTLRQSDLFARYGGEEFVVLAPNAGAGAARDLAERIRAAVAELGVAVEGGELSFTVSIGVSTLEPDGAPDASGSPLEALLARADEALYVAKAAGRNRVESLSLSPARA